MPRFPETDAITSKLPFFNGGHISTVGNMSSMFGTNAPVLTTNWPSANLALFVPVNIPERVTVVQLGWYNGTSAAHNADAGIYTLDGTLIISTTPTAQGGATSAWQFVNITDTIVGPGCFYLAISLSGTSRLATYAVTTAAVSELHGFAEQASAGTLPATATMVVTTRALFPLIVAMTAGGI
jgi:hypothetical protein